ncbi:MAG: phosphodiesterase YaeI [Verrucomicrobiota bacterium]
MKLSLFRRHFLKMVAALGIAGLAGYVYMRYIEPRWLRQKKVAVKLKGRSLKAPVRVLHLSDLHLSEEVSLEFITSAVEKGIAHQPDLICVTGDFITRKLFDNEAYRAVLKRLSKTAPTFCCLGNHDGGKWATRHFGYRSTAPIKAFLAQTGIQCLVNRWARVEIKGEPIHIIGLGDLWAHQAWPKTAFGGLPDEDATRIVLAHNPDTKTDLKMYRFELMLFGHTHGGQLSLPVIGTPFAPVRDQRFVSGLKEWEGRLIHITHGIGNVLGLRFNCRPEVSILDVT